jgi:hypothetical protein
MDLFRLFRTTCYILPFGTPGKHTQAWASPPSPTRCELATPPSMLVEYIETERWPIPRAFLDRCSSVSPGMCALIFLQYHCTLIASYTFLLVGGVLTRWVSQAVGYGRSMFLKLCPCREHFSVVPGETALLHATRGLKWPNPTSP